MAGTSRDMTAERPGGTSPVYGIYGPVNTDAATLPDLLSGGAVIRQIPVSVLLALESGSSALRDEALDRVAAAGEGLPLTTATCLDDYWNTSLHILNDDTAYGPLAASRCITVDKATTYDRLTAAGVQVPDYFYSNLSPQLIDNAIAAYGPRPVLKPATGTSSLGVYRYRDDLSPADNLAYYRILLRMGNVPATSNIIAMRYVGGAEGMEISAEITMGAGRVISLVVHEKLTSTQVHPFVDRAMVSPPVHPKIIDALPDLRGHAERIAAALGVVHGVLHAELRLDGDVWQALDIAVRPGGGLIAHSVQAITGIDPRVCHILAGLGQPVSDQARNDAAAAHNATCIACCYTPSARRAQVTFANQAQVAADFRGATDVIGWHINAAEVVDALFEPDAGLSVGVGAPAPQAALTRLRALVEPHGYTAA
ncbi:ATP-grasp domain-containing protein [Catellatospora sichuanensis]|uniref:ATP-grasp domain-containing protein n=1 Tax=Catellatospora sichuanensis TaxID=1969805 RepID=UPI001184417C|nr:ATP-grasp domain-containing protein [Catellatospora sichuanensis]